MKNNDYSPDIVQLQQIRENNSATAEVDETVSSLGFFLQEYGWGVTYRRTNDWKVSASLDSPPHHGWWETNCISEAPIPQGGSWSGPRVISLS